MSDLYLTLTNSIASTSPILYPPNVTGAPFTNPAVSSRLMKRLKVFENKNSLVPTRKIKMNKTVSPMKIVIPTL